MHMSSQENLKRCGVASGGGDPQPSGTLPISSPLRTPHQDRYGSQCRVVIRAQSPDHSTSRRFLCMMSFVLVASTMTSAPKVQVITHLICKALRPEYTHRSGTGPTVFASDDEETKLCNADPVVQAASAEFLASGYPICHPFRTPEANPLVLQSNYHCNRCSDLFNYGVLGISEFLSHPIYPPGA